VRLTVWFALISIAALGGRQSAYAAELDKSPSISYYDELGFSLGTPAGVNLEWEHVATDMTLTASGMIWGSTRGLQFGFTPAFFRTADNKAKVQLIAGISQLNPVNRKLERWRYAGVEFVWRPRRFLLGLGVTAGTGTFSTPQMSVRIGLVWRI
jgi:hypothetical protein